MARPFFSKWMILCLVLFLLWIGGGYVLYRATMNAPSPQSDVSRESGMAPFELFPHLREQQ